MQVSRPQSALTTFILIIIAIVGAFSLGFIALNRDEPINHCGGLHLFHCLQALRAIHPQFRIASGFNPHDAGLSSQ